LPAAALEPLLDEIRSGKFGPSGELNEKQIAQRVHQLRQTAKDLADRFNSLERELVEKRQSLGEQPPPGGDIGTELARLESAAAEAKQQLDETLAELRRYENAGAVSTSAAP
jgi:chromosome segregation ATPase